ncbi:MAG: hypothetical protein O7H41_00970 [Planctomycetota bacterium]|nr:hypothetical protein [Planctomycetota bacterium]
MFHKGRFLTLLLLVIALPAIAQADRIKLKNGEIIEGKITLETSGSIYIRTAIGTRAVKLEDVLEIEKEKSPRELYKEKASAIAKGDANGHYELGLWCKEKGLEKQARSQYRSAVRLVPDHEGARGELGYVQREGKWVLPDEAEETNQPEKPDGESGGADGTAKRGLDFLASSPEANRQDADAAWKARMAEYKGVRWKKRWEISGTGFELHCNATKEVAEWYAKAIERIDEELRKFFKKAKKVRFENEETMVFIYKSREDYLNHTQKPKAAGFFNVMDGSIHAYHGRVNYTSDTVGVLAHEWTHKWEAKVVPNWRNMPPWIYEGLAVYFGDGIVVPREGPAKAQQLPRDSLLLIQRAIREDRYIKIKDLMERGPREFSGFYYPHAWSVIYMMVNTSKGNRSIFNQVFSDCIKTRFTLEKFEGYCKRIGGIEGFEQKWKEWVLSLEVPPSGSVMDSTFRSDFANFSVTLPDPTWSFDMNSSAVGANELNAFQAVMKKEDALIKILAVNNRQTLTPEGVVERELKFLEKTNKVLSSDSLTLNGYDAYQIYYTSEPPEKEEEPKEGEGQGGKEPEPKPDEPPEEEKKDGGKTGTKEPPTKMRRVFLATVPHLIIIECSAPSDQFLLHDTDFEKALESIQLYFD